MKVEIDYSRCEGHGVCVGLAPSTFELGDEDEQVRLVTENPERTAEEAVTLAAKRCPTQSIRIHP